MSKINNLLAEEGAAAENYEMSEELRAGVTASRPNLGPSSRSQSSGKRRSNTGSW
ncbi:MAG: hypothetical protein ACR2GA_04785 [Chloroflexota bacterium]